MRLRGLRGRVDWKAVARGAAVGFTAALVLLVVYVILDPDLDDDSNVVFLLYLPPMVALGVGGAIAARRRLDLPFVHGTLAAVAGYLPIAVISSALNLANGDSVNPVGVAFNALVSVLAGLMGALAASWWASTRSTR